MNLQKEPAGFHQNGFQFGDFQVVLGRDGRVTVPLGLRVQLGGAEGTEADRFKGGCDHVAAVRFL